MGCKYCSSRLTYENLYKLKGACSACHRHYEQLRAGFKGVKPEPKDETVRWDNSSAYEEWLNSLNDPALAEKIAVDSKGTYTEQRCDIRDMRSDVGLPKFEPLEGQVFTAWIEEGVKDNKMQEVLGLNYRQLSHVKAVVRIKLKKQMAYYLTVKRLSKDAEGIKKRKGI
jgi:hypothetical protein